MEKTDTTFEGVDENMELDTQEQRELTEFETVKQGKANADEIEFDKIQMKDLMKGKSKKQEYRKIPVPRHRFTPLKTNWESILKTLVQHMKLQVRMNTKRRAVELRTSEATQDVGAIQKGADFLKAFMLGFEI